MANILNRIFRGVLGDILDKPKTPLGNLPKEDKIDKTRRGVIAGGVAAPVAVGAGVLNELPVEKVVDKFEGGFKTIIKPKVEPKIAGSDLFKNIGQEAKFAAEMYNAKTGKNLTPKEIIERDMAEYLYWTEEGNYGLEEAARKLKSDLVYEVLDEVGYEVDNPKVMKVFQKYMGDADEYVYGSSGGDELAQKLFKQENPDKFSAEGVEYEDADIIDWIKSKGIHKTKYYKQLKRAGEETRS